MLNKIKTLLGITDTTKDTLLNLLIDDATIYVQQATHRDDLNAILEEITVRCVVWDYGRLKTEGLQSENYSGIAYTYEPDYPEPIMRQIRAQRKVRTL